MIRKQTWILLGVFSLLLGLAFYLRENPVAGGVSTTPTSTPPASLLPGWKAADIVWIKYTSTEQEAVELNKTGQVEWVFVADDPLPVDAGLAEKARTQIASVRVMAFLDSGYDLQALGLDKPGKQLSIRDAQGRQVNIRFGMLTPTENGYFVRVDDQPPSVINKFSVDAIFESLQIDQFIPQAAGLEAENTSESGTAP
jgi:hypothetical protein